MDYYDLMDTLVTIPNSKNYSEYLSNLSKAQVKYTPRGRFSIITSQPYDAFNKVVSLVANLFPNCVQLYVVNSTGAKVFTLRRLRADNYTDNDPQVRNTITNKLPEVALYKIVNGVKVRAD